MTIEVPATPSTPAPTADSLKESGNALLAQGDFAGAVREYTAAIQLAPTSHVLFSNRSAANLKLGHVDEALEDAQKCVELNAGWAKGYSRLGAAFQAKSKFDEAIEAYNKGLALEPTNAALVSGLAEAKSLAAENEDPIIGIDLGTTYSCVGVWEGDGVTIIPDAEGRRTTPSVVSFVGETFERRIGHDAKRQMSTNAAATLFDCKRIIGQRFNDEQVQRDIKRFPYSVTSDANGKPVITIPNGGPKLTPEEVAAVILGEMKKIAENHLKRPVSRAIVTVPAYFSDAQRQATKDAGAIAGLNVLRVINEPTAAALAYGLDAKSLNAQKDDSERKILVFDLGGGTFDVSVLSIDRGMFEVLATGGDTHLGGEDFDNAIVEYLVSEIKKQFDVKDLDQKARSRLRVAAEQAKIALSAAQSTRIVLDGVLDGKSIELTRAKFEKLNEEPFKRCLDTVKRVMRDAKAKVDDVNDIVLVGGSTRIPLVREKLREMFGGRQLCQSINPDEAVAYGAAVQGAIMRKNKHATTSQLVLVDVTPLSLGIECTGKIFSVVIPRNTPLPVQRQKVYSTEEDFQTQIDVRIFEGERQCTDGNNLLGEFRIDGIERAKRGVPQVEVSFTVSVDGILTVTARDLVTGVSGNVSIAANSGRLTDSDIATMLADAEKFRKADADRAERMEALNELEHLIGEMADSGKFPTATNNVKEWLEKSRDTLSTKLLRAKSAEIAKKMSVG